MIPRDRAGPRGFIISRGSLDATVELYYLFIYAERAPAPDLKKGS